MRLLGGDHFAGKQQLHGNALAHQAGQALRSAIAGNDAELDFRLTEFGILTGQAHGARQRDLAAAAQRESVDAGDHGLAAVLDQVQHRLAAVRVFLGGHGIVPGQLADVSARDERLVAGAGEEDGAHGRLALDLVKGAAQLFHGGHVEGVQHLGAVHRDLHDGALFFVTRKVFFRAHRIV